MKKHLFFGMFAAVGMTLATSCTNDENVIPSSNEAQVTFSLGLESGINTRAISDGTGINQLFYAIFDKDGNLVKPATNQEVNKFPLDANISLVKGETYTAVFWAWDKDCEAYTIEDNKTVKIDYSKIPNNNEDSDAFFKNVTFTVDGNENISIVLKRAFAQLNVGITAEEWETATDQGVEITKSTVTIKQAATTLNLLNGTVGGAKDITLEADAIPTETLKVDANCDGDDEEYVYLSMSYFLANDESDGASKTTLGDLNFTFSSNNGKSFILTEGLANAPVQRNHRTNIISFGGIGGGIITGDVTVKVLLDPLYDGEHTLTTENVWEDYLGIYTEEALAGKTIEIPEGWHIRNGYILEPMPEYWTAESSPLYEKSYTIDGKGNTVTFEPYAYKFTAKNAFAAADGQPVIVKNLTFAGEHFGVFGGVYGGVNGRNGYNTTFEKVQIVNNKIYCYNKDGSHPVTAFSSLGNATLNNCIIKGTKHVGEEKDKDNENQHVTKALAQGVYDILVPNLYNAKADYKTTINDSEIGSIYVKEQGRLIVTGNSVVDKIIGNKLFYSNKYPCCYIKIEGNASVKEIDVTSNSSSSYPIVKIEAGATVDTLQLNDINVKNVTIEDGATITKIIWNGTEYTSIADFKTAAGL